MNRTYFNKERFFNHKGRQGGTKNAKMLCFVVTISLISTALFPCCVMSTVGDISLINGAMCQCVNSTIRQWGNGTRMMRMEWMNTDFFMDLLCKGGWKQIRLC